MLSMVCVWVRLIHVSELLVNLMVRVMLIMGKGLVIIRLMGVIEWTNSVCIGLWHHIGMTITMWIMTFTVSVVLMARGILMHMINIRLFLVVYIIVEEWLNLNIALCHLVKNVRRLSFLIGGVMILSVPVLSRGHLWIIVMLSIMLIVLLLVVHVARMLMARSRLLVMVEAMLATVSCREAFMLGLMKCFTLRSMFVLILFVGVSRLPGRVLIVHLTLMDVCRVSIGG